MNRLEEIRARWAAITEENVFDALHGGLGLGSTRDAVRHAPEDVAWLLEALDACQRALQYNVAVSTASLNWWREGDTVEAKSRV